MKTILRSQDLTCPTCVAKIETALRRLPGVQDAKVQFTTGRIEVNHDPQQAGADDLVRVVRQAGYRASVSAF